MLEIPRYLRDSTEIMSDPFSDILRLTNAQTVVSGGFAAGGAWAIRFPAPGKIKFFGVLKGMCWLCMDGAEPVRIGQGDVFLLSSQHSFVLAGDLQAPPLDASVLFADGSKFARIGDVEDCEQVGGHVRLDAASGPLLADVLPALIHVRASSPHAAVLQWVLDQLVRERTASQPGSEVASAQLAQLMLVHILRAHLAEAASFPAGLLRALVDERIAPALRLMHGEPARAWQLDELATASAMSRTTFASRFKAAAGVPPLTYLLNWRMRIAGQMLRDGNAGIAAVAQSVGYTSESAFSNAFKRVMGTAPRRYRGAYATAPGSAYVDGGAAASLAAAGGSAASQVSR
jgi:AraC-like DNA-binding protein